MEKKLHNFSYEEFKNHYKEMVAKNEASWTDLRYGSAGRVKDYTLDEVEQIIASNSIMAQRKLSRNYFMKDGIYRRLVIYYGTLLKYAGILIPHAGIGKNLSSSHINKRYYLAMNYLDKINTVDLFTNCAIRALVDGSYFGVIQKLDKNEIVLLDLPSSYCRSKFKDLKGNDIVEFDVSYFDSIVSSSEKNETLAAYPKEVIKHYRRYKSGKESSPWVVLPMGVGICFQLFDGRPLLLNTIPSTIEYDEAVKTERERDLEEIRKIIVQKIPHLNDGSLLFEPPEAQVMHDGAVGMMKGNPNISILTTYADVDAIVSKTAADTASNNLEKMLQNVYSEAGASSQIFSPVGNLAIETSIKNDMALMMVLANKFSIFTTNIINELFANSNISFKYTILPINYYNESSYMNDALKMAQAGYSALLPAIAMGFSQSDLIGIKSLENDVLKIGEKLVPPGVKEEQEDDGSDDSNNQQVSTGKVGAPEKPIEEKSPKTIQNQQSIDNTGGSKYG